MKNFTTYIERLGRLHDCRVLKVIFEPSKASVRIELDDLYGNFEGLPEYQGLTPACMVFAEVGFIAINFDPTAGK